MSETIIKNTNSYIYWMCHYICGITGIYLGVYYKALFKTVGTAFLGSLILTASTTYLVEQNSKDGVLFF